MLFLDNLTIGYTGKTVAGGLSARLPAGAMTCLIGRNGTGKSTLLRTVAGFQPPLSGRVMITPTPGAAPVEASSLSPRERARTIGVVLTARPAVDAMTAREVVAMGRMPYTGFWGRLSDRDNDIVDHAMRLTDTTHLASCRIGAVSDGERQKIMIAKALAQQTPLILLDEPTAFLDYPSKLFAMTMLRALCHDSGVTVLVSTHDLDAALRLTDRLWIMDGGTLHDGTPQELRRETAAFMRC